MNAPYSVVNHGIQALALINNSFEVTPAATDPFSETQISPYWNLTDKEHRMFFFFLVAH